MNPVAQWRSNHPGAIPPSLKRAAGQTLQATRTIRSLPDFIIIGAQRAGTTSLFNYLASHPQIGVSYKKEVHFFDSPSYRAGLDWYRGHFPTRITKRLATRLRGKYLLGEASPYYIFYPHTPERIRRDLPNTKLIALLRNPIDRALSQYRRNIAHGLERLPALDAFQAEEDRLRDINDRIAADPDFYSADHVHYSYKARGVYADQIKRWHATFPPEQLLILQSEDLYHRPEDAMLEVTAFLEIEDAETQRFQTFNAGPPASTSTRPRTYLAEYFRPYNRDLADVLGTMINWRER